MFGGEVCTKSRFTSQFWRVKEVCTRGDAVSTCTYLDGIESVSCGSLEEDEREDSGIAGWEKWLTKKIKCLVRYRSLQLVAFCQD